MATAKRPARSQASCVTSQVKAARILARSASRRSSELICSGPRKPAKAVSAKDAKYVAWRSRMATSSPLATNCSKPNSRTVSSIKKRGSPADLHRAVSGSRRRARRVLQRHRVRRPDWSPPPPPRKCSHRKNGESPEEELLGRGGSRSWLQAIASRSVRCRAGASRAPLVRTCSRRSRRFRSAWGERSFHGRPLARWQVAAHPTARRSRL